MDDDFFLLLWFSGIHIYHFEGKYNTNWRNLTVYEYRYNIQITKHITHNNKVLLMADSTKDVLSGGLENDFKMN